MKRTDTLFRLQPLAASLLALWQPAHAITVTDNFTGAVSTQPWVIPVPADTTKHFIPCLTAATSGTNSGSSIPYCSSSGIDPSGQGALRLTSATNYKIGSIVSGQPFPASNGINVTFTTYTYGGNGADGISFYLIDADKAAAASTAGLIPTTSGGSISNTVGATVGATGGSLGYSCSNGNPFADGVYAAYMGLGIDEYGNFLNQGDNTNTGNSFQAGRIALRGAGGVNYKELQNTYGTAYYPNGLSTDNQRAGVQRTCSTGSVQKWSGSSWGSVSPPTGKSAPQNYAMLKTASGTPAAVVLPSTTPMWTSNTSRSNAKPITYQLKITSAGKLSFSYSYNGGVYSSIISNQDITADNGNLPANLLFGFAASTGGLNNIHEISCFKADPAATSSDSAALNLPTGQYKTGAQIYIGSYNPNNWSGQLAASDLLYNSTTGDVTVASIPNWDASCVLTGGNCTTTGVTDMTAQSTRNILSWNGTKGVPFTWPATVSADTLTTKQKEALSDNTSFLNGEIRLNYLRGQRTNEATALNKPFRVRTSVLGDIVNSSPTWVGPPSAPYPGGSYSSSTTWKDNLFPGQTPSENAGLSTSYGTYQTNKASRQNLVFVGSNDGMLHGFRAGYYDSNGNYVKTGSIPNDGQESIAYIPGAAVSDIHDNSTFGLDYSSPNYGHAYHVDATPGTGDLFFGGSWKTWLIGGMGYGGQSIFALDITDPSLFSEANAASLVKGEWSYSSDTASIFNNLGKTYGTPQIRRFHNGQWGAVFGNGWCFTTTNSLASSDDSTCQKSATGKAGIFVMLLDGSGTPSFKFLNTNNGTTAKPNGIAYVTPVDLDDDHIVDYVYAGDLLGNIWRFDLTSSDPNAWTVSSTTPLFTAPSGQPITTQVMVSTSKAYNELQPRVILNFATGVVVPQNLTDEAKYAGPANTNSKAQSVYGIWDWNMSGWNGKGSTQYASLASGTSQLGQANLKKQTFSISGTTRSIGSNTVCWQGSSGIAGCSAYSQYGWYADLTTQTTGNNTVYEQVIYNPIISLGALIFNTTIPAINSPLSCTTTNGTGWTFALDPTTGSGLPGFFSGNTSDTIGYAAALNATGSPAVVNVYGQPVVVTKNSAGSASATKVYPNSGGYRINWIQLR